MLSVFKPYGATPKEVVDLIIKKYGAKKGAFAGRLDPMACGIMNVYLDEKCKDILNSNGKIYRFIVCFGMTSDTGDLLGIADCDGIPTRITEEQIRSVIRVGSYIQKQPVHSSLPVKNKDGVKQPLWWWAQQNRLGEIEIPSFERTLYSYKILNIHTMTLSDISKIATTRINLIDPKHNFRQAEIIERWNTLSSAGNTEFVVAEFEVSVSSGFYIRQFARDIGDNLNVKTVVIEIERLGYIG